MSDQSPLLVPMTVEALVVNDSVRAPNQIETFMRTQMSYNSIQTGGNGQPLTNGNDANFTQTVNVPPNNIPSSQYYNGVYLKWRLPKAFTSGTQNNVTGVTTYPLVPNRWLVIRYSGPLTARQATAWIVESDFTYPVNSPPSSMNASQGATLFAQPASSTNNTPIGVYIGRNVQLGAWTESGHSIGLTAMGPGNPSFAFYQPQCNNVFSFIDPLYGQPDQALSYLVLGWFSSGANDPFNPGASVVSPNAQSGFISTIAYAAASSVETQWSAGTLTDGSGNILNIAAGTTGAMIETTYIYLNPAVSTTTLQITTSLDTAQAPGCTIIATADPFFIAQLGALGWELPTGTDPTLTATWTLLAGSVNGVQWQSTQRPPGGTPDGSLIPVSVAVGNTSVEALTALINAQAASKGETIDSELLEAFQLNVLDIFDQPDGSAVLAEKLRASFFQRRNSGYTWSIVDAPESTVTQSNEELAKEAAWLATLNQNQQALDAAELQLAALQRQLYVLWWKFQSWAQQYFGSSAIPCLADEDGQAPSSITNQLDPTINGSLAWQVFQLQNSIATLSAQVPSGSTPEALEQAIAVYASNQKLPATRLLKRGLEDTFFLPNNPVVLVAGAGSSGIVQAPNTLTCRFPSQVVTGFNFNSAPITAATSGISIPQPVLSGVSGVPWQTALITRLVNEFYFVDSNNAASVAAAIGADPTAVETQMSESTNDLNVYPTGGVENWTANPWHPLLIFWETSFYPIAYGTPAAPNWIFEGTQYTWNESMASVSPFLGLKGVIQLTPNATFNMQSRLQQFLATNPNLPQPETQALKDLLEAVDTDDSWDLLSQQLDGFNEQLMLGTSGVFLSPAASTFVTTPSLASLIGSAGTYPTLMPPIPTQDEPIPTSQFQPWRAGQFEFINLILVDEWGQALWPFTKDSYTKEIIFLPPDLTPVLISNVLPLTVTAAPAIASVSPSVVPTTASGSVLTVTGVNFDSSAQILWNSTALTTTFVSSTQLTAPLPSNLVAGAATITVIDHSVTSNSLPVQVTGALGLSAISPNLYQAGMVPSDTLTINVTGYGFASGALVTWNGTPVNTMVRSATSLTASVPAANLFAPGTVSIGVTVGGSASNPLAFSIVDGAAVGSLSPSLVATAGEGFTLTVNGVGFASNSVVNWNGAALTTTYVSAQQLTAAVPSNLLTSATVASITESVGSKVHPEAPDPFIQLPPALLQPARLTFNLVSAADNNLSFGPANPTADPIAGWVLPNHLDSSLMAYDVDGNLLGELSIGVSTSGSPQVFWTNAPFSPYQSLKEISQAIPHFGPFLLALFGKTPAEVTSFLDAIDETLWTTVPAGANFDQNLAVLIGRPLAFVRARLQFLLEGAVFSDPSWANTFAGSNCSQLAPPASPVTGYQFGIQLGNVAQLDDGLIGYFVGDNYDSFNVVTQSGAQAGAYLKPIGVDNNFLYQPFDGVTQTFVSMLVDPRAPVHASTSILPDVSVALPPSFTATAMNSMNVTFRVNGLLTDQRTAAPDAEGITPPTTILTAVPKLETGGWSWMENGDAGWTIYPTAPNDTTARLTEVAPVLRRGLLRLSSALDAVEARRAIFSSIPKLPTKEK
ncbi:MAG: IPT/TIG domain-containing protein [Terracidiphilus sp.]